MEQLGFYHENYSFVTRLTDTNNIYNNNNNNVIPICH